MTVRYDSWDEGKLTQMKKHALIAVGSLLVAATAAQADLVVSIEGPQVLDGGAGITVTTTNLVGTLTGISVTLSYSGAAGGSWVQDTGVTVDDLQWGGYDVFVNGASDYLGTIVGFPNNGASGNYVGTGSGASVVYSNQSAVVGIGNGYSFGGSSMTLDNIKITLHGVDKAVPGPAAFALLGLAGFAGARRRRA